MITHAQARNLAALYARAQLVRARDIVDIADSDLRRYIEQFPVATRSTLRDEFTEITCRIVANFTNENEKG